MTVTLMYLSQKMENSMYDYLTLTTGEKMVKEIQLFLAAISNPSETVYLTQASQVGLKINQSSDHYSWLIIEFYILAISKV